MKRTILLLLSFTLILINSQSGMSEKNQTDFFNRQHYRKSVKEFTYKDPLPYIKQGEKTASKTDWEWLKYISYAIVIAVIVFFIYRLILYAYAPDNRKVKNNQVQLNEIEDEPTIESDLDGLLEIALKEKNFKEAIRINYLLSIRKLNEGKIIVYTIDKTNFDYVAEVGGHPVFSTFRDLTLTFERIWFGDAPVDEKNFNQYQLNYTKLTSAISSNRSKPTVL